MRRGTAGTRTAETLPRTEGRSENTEPECDESASPQVLLNLVKSGGTPLKFLKYQCENVTQLMRLPSPHPENNVSSPWKHSGSLKRANLRKKTKNFHNYGAVTRLLRAFSAASFSDSTLGSFFFSPFVGHRPKKETKSSETRHEGALKGLQQAR